MSIDIFGPCPTDGDECNTSYCGIKGSRPRMSYCCNKGHLALFGNNTYDAPIALAQADHCSQYCYFYIANIDLWLYWLTEEGDTVSNAFCHSSDGSHLTTSGLLPRDGPFDPGSRLIEQYKGPINEPSRHVTNKH